MPKVSEPGGASPYLKRGRGVAVALVAVGLVGGAIALAPRSHRTPSAGPLASSPRAGSPKAKDRGAAPEDAGATKATPSAAAAPPPYLELDGGTLAERNEALLTNMQRALGLGPDAMDAVRAVFHGSDWIGQGNPKPTHHPLTRAECLERRAHASRVAPADLRCGAPNMVPLYDPAAGESAATAKQCIDQFEFPNIECEYPVVWVRANEAQALCHALGKRLCDAHEWEGACAGAVKSPDSEYAWGERRIMMQYLHNQHREIVWSYGKEKNHALCATGSKKGPKCLVPTWNGCGSNDYPAGSFPECVSPLGVYDLNGNAAEHMNFPRTPAELGSRGGSGETEMKGSWFIFLQAEAHEDDCRWRAPDWHVTRVDDTNSHRNYHLGFRCCKDLESADAGSSLPSPRSEDGGAAR
jgi:sulfatase modifying factor 1